MKTALAIVLMALITVVPPAQCGNDPAREKELAAKQAEEYVTKGNSYYSQGQYDNALQQYNTAISLNPSATGYIGRARTYYFGSKRYLLAADELTLAIELEPSNASAYYYRGWANYSNGAIDKALADFNKAVELNPSLIQARFIRAWCLAHKAQWDMSSLLYLYQMFESDAALSHAFQGPGWHYVKVPQWEFGAIPDPVKAVDQPPALAEAWCNRGFSLLKKAEWEQALTEFNNALKKDPTLNRSDWNRDWVTRQRDSWNQVIAEYEKVIEAVAGKAVPAEMKPTQGTVSALLDSSAASYNQAVTLSRDPWLSQTAKTALSFIDSWRKELSVK